MQDKSTGTVFYNTCDAANEKKSKDHDDHVTAGNGRNSILDRGKLTVYQGILIWHGRSGKAVFDTTMQMTSTGTRPIINSTPRAIRGRGKPSSGLENDSRINYAGQAR